MLQLFQFAFRSNLLGKSCNNSDEYNTQILIVCIVGLALLF